MSLLPYGCVTSVLSSVMSTGESSLLLYSSKESLTHRECSAHSALPVTMRSRRDKHF